MTDLRRLQLAAALHPDRVEIRLDRDRAALRAARRVAADDAASPAARLLAMAQAGALSADQAERTINAHAAVRAAIVAAAEAAAEAAPDRVPGALLAFGDGAQMGDVAVGAVAGRDVVTINVYLREGDR